MCSRAQAEASSSNAGGGGGGCSGAVAASSGERWPASVAAVTALLQDRACSEAKSRAESSAALQLRRAAAPTSSSTLGLLGCGLGRLGPRRLRRGSASEAAQVSAVRAGRMVAACVAPAPPPYLAAGSAQLSWREINEMINDRRDAIEGSNLKNDGLGLTGTRRRSWLQRETRIITKYVRSYRARGSRHPVYMFTRSHHPPNPPTA